MIAKIGGLLHWYKTTATIIGLPVLAYLIFLGVIGCIAQVTCTFAGSACMYSFTGSVAHAQRTLANIPPGTSQEDGFDVVVKPNRK